MNKHGDLSIMRHSCEHALTQAMERLWPKIVKAMGPATDEGFYFDFDLNGEKISEADFPKIETEMAKIIKEDLPIKHEEMTIVEARKLFKNNPYKQEWLAEIEERGEKASVYRTGPSTDSTSSLQASSGFVDLCAGPHLTSTGKIGAFKLLSVAGAYWRGSEKNKMLTRIYGTCFATQKELDDYLALLEQIKLRDHKKIGPALGLFFLDETAPGMPYWLPKGTIIYNELLKFWREEHKKRGYLETITPLLNKKQLYETSGHWEHYRENMFVCETEEKEVYCLKPMNCPNAMIIFKSTNRSYRDLPLRISDCDTLHRKEKTGQIDGLLRVQKFAQDDAHIFVTEDQIKSEYENIFEIAKLFYSVFGIKFKIRLGTNPDDFIGDKETWNKAEKILKEILETSGFEYFVGEGEGAFYGPKLDIMMEDFGGRLWQTGTIQLDFQLPQRFNLKYTDNDGKEKMPVVIHRVIYGSLERFIGILIEHYAGAFPLWLSPVQVAVLPITDKQEKYAQEVAEKLKEVELRVELWNAQEPLGAKIRNATLQKINYLVIIGEREEKTKTVAIRTRKGEDMGQMAIDKFMKILNTEIGEKKI